MSCTVGNTGDVAAAAAEIDSTVDTVAEDRSCWPPPAVAVGSYSAHWMPAFPRDWRIETAAVAAAVRRRQWLGVAGVVAIVAVVAAAGGGVD